MMFMIHAAFFLGILALTAGISMYVWSIRNQGPGVKLVKFFGILFMIVVILDMGCMLYYGIKYWSQGYFETPMAMHQMPMQMQNSMSGQQNMMQGMMNGNNPANAQTTHAHGK